MTIHSFSFVCCFICFKKSLQSFSLGFFVWFFFFLAARVNFSFYVFFSLYIYLACESLSGMWMCAFLYIVLRPHTRWSGWDVGACFKILALIIWINEFETKTNKKNPTKNNNNNDKTHLNPYNFLLVLNIARIFIAYNNYCKWLCSRKHWATKR